MDYKNGKIYSIRSHQTDDIYYGSTTQTLTKRLSKHKGNFKLWKENKYNYVSSFEIIKYDDCYIELVENFPCNNKDELHKREGEIIRANPCVNKNIPGRTIKEYKEDNKEKIIEYNKQYNENNKDKLKEYRENNKEKINEYKKQPFNCECGSCLTISHKSRHLKSQKHIDYINNLQK